MKGLIFTYVLTYGGAAVSLFRPWYGFLVYVCFAALRPELLWSYSLPSGHYSRIVGVALIVGWAVHGFGNWRFGRARVIVGALLGYWLWQILSAWFADIPAVAWRQVGIQSKIILPVLVGITLIEDVKQLRQLAWVLVVSLGFIAYEANIAYWSGNNWIRFNGFGTMDNNSISIAMVAGACVAFFLGLNETVTWRRWLAFVIAAFLAHVPLIADSRGGMLGLVVSGVICFVLIPKSPRHLAVFALAAIIALRMMGPSVQARFSTIFVGSALRDESAQSRLDLWGDAWDTMLKHPALGVGPDHWPIASLSYGWDKRKECHSLWFNAGAETGFFGATCLLVFYAACIGLLTVLLRSRERPPSIELVGFARMVIASLIGFAVSASFVSLDNLETPYHIVVLGAGVLMLYDRQKETCADESQSRDEWSEGPRASRVYSYEGQQ